MSIVTLKSAERGGVQIAWIDYSGRLLLSIRDYQGYKAQLTSDQVEFILEFLGQHPPADEEAARDAFYKAQDQAAEAELAAPAEEAA